MQTEFEFPQVETVDFEKLMDCQLSDSEKLMLTVGTLLAVTFQGGNMLDQ